MKTMRAKLVVRSVERGQGWESLKLNAVTSKPFDANGNNEDNTFARYTPSAELAMSITNPELHGAFNPGDAFYVDFTPVPVEG